MNKPIFIKKDSATGRLMRWSNWAEDKRVSIPEGWYFRDANLLVVANEIRPGVYSASDKYAYLVVD